MQTDNQGQPQQGEEENKTSTDAEQTVLLNSAQAAQQLEVDARTIRRYINEGIHTADGSSLRLEASQVRTSRGLEWQISQNDLNEFKQAKDHAATQGQSAAQIHARIAMQAEQSQAYTLPLQMFATELELRAQALAQAQATIERLAYEAGRQVGRNEVLERERATLQQRLAKLEHQQWRPQKPLHRIRFLPLEGAVTFDTRQSSLPLWPQQNQSSSES